MATMAALADAPHGPAPAPFLAGFAEAPPDLPGAGRPWVEALRAGGLETFARLGVPTRKVEAWKYTDLRRLSKLSLVPAPALADGVPAGLEALLAAAGDGYRVVFVNGRLRPDLSRLAGLPAGVRLDGLAALIEADDPLVAERLGRSVPEAPDADPRPFLALNTALMQDGYVLALDPGAVVDRPIHVVFWTEPGGVPCAAHPRHLLVAGANSQATVVEHHGGADDAPYLTVAAYEAAVDPGAKLRHYRLQREGAQAVHLSHVLASVAADAAYESFVLTLGGALTRNEGAAVLAGRNADLHLNGAYLVAGDEVVDNTTVIDHAEPDGRSREVFRGVLDDKARAVFQGRIQVRRNAQRTDGHQLSQVMLLSPGAEADNKPELEIFADDVKCSHGATAGEIDHDALFYLRSRGIAEDVARALLIEAFIAETIDEIADEPVRDGFLEAVRAWLIAHGERIPT
jgi:Fe-S cluster assembly protein SufD